MAVDVTAERVIARPPQDVAAYAMDARHDPEWIGGIRTAEIVDADEVTRGVRVRRVAKFLGRRIEYVNEVVEFDPPRRLRMRSVQAPFPMEVTYTFEPHPGGTMARIRVQGSPGRFYAFATPVLARMVMRSISGDLERLRRTLER